LRLAADEPPALKSAAAFPRDDFAAIEMAMLIYDMPLIFARHQKRRGYYQSAATADILLPLLPPPPRRR